MQAGGDEGGGLKRVLVACLLVFFFAAAAHADVPDAAACAAAGAAAEQAAGVPANLLVSIGVVESGRADGFGHVAPWPWTVNADGAGQYFASKADAEAFVRLALSSGARDVDVGCFQVSLQSHPDAFASLDDAFDPQKNAAYAALFLTQLKTMTGGWESAVADYHSATPELGLPYQRRVLAAWHGLGNMPAGFGAVTADAFAMPVGVVIKLSAAGRGVHVYEGGQAVARAGLPRVFSP
jgi:hypothetical protein